MKTEQEMQAYIDKFSAGEIPAAEFERQLANDEALQKEFELHQKDMLAIRVEVKNQLKIQATAHLANHSTRSARRLPLMRVMQIAALFLLVMGSVFLFSKEQPLEARDLYVSYFELPEQVNVRASTNRDKTWDDAMASYEQGDFKETATLLSNMTDQEVNTFPNRGYLYLGLSLLMDNDANAAIENFEKVDVESSYAFDAEWFIALAHLKQEDLEKARISLTKIANQARHYKQQEAKEILARLN